MPQQTPIDRTSMRISLEERYNSQHVGGTYDAKNVKTQPIDFGLQDKLYENPPGLLPDNFNEKALKFAESLGHTNQKYKP
jgi:hypothetical protein